MIFINTKRDVLLEWHKAAECRKSLIILHKIKEAAEWKNILAKTHPSWASD